MMNDDEPGVIEAAVAGFAARSRQTDRQTDNLTFEHIEDNISYCTCRRRSCQQQMLQ
jgi:hypothetical protein